MKKITFCLMTACLSLMFHPLDSSAATIGETSSLVSSKHTEATEAKVLLLRLNEINAMDKSTLNPSEKKSLRIEVRSIQHKLNAIGGGIYISVGALIIIILLLIILF